MRTLLTLGTLATALLVPWNSLVDSWGIDTSTAATKSDAHYDFDGPGARLDAELGILPITSETDSPADDPTSPISATPEVGRKRLNLAELFATPDAKEFAQASDSPPGMICEDGVCRVRSEPEAQPGSRRPVTAEMTWEQARRSLDELGVTQFRLERIGDGNGYRFSCAVPVSEGSRALRRFEATADDDLAAVAQVLSDIASWQDLESAADETGPTPDDEAINVGRTTRPPDLSGL